jgi:pyruvate/2-oxoglutarate dehydrogenase complex dihydrolipoamide acyltransferase (E2) component
MAYEFKLPDIGEGVVEGEIVGWKVAVGDRVAIDQPLVEVMTDKATVEIPSPRAGIIQRIGFQPGDICPVGAVLVVIDEGGKPSSSAGSTLDLAASANPNLVPTGEPPGHIQPQHHASAGTRADSDDRPTARVNMDGAVARERVKAWP